MVMETPKKKNSIVYKVSPQEWSFVKIVNKIEKIGNTLDKLDLSGCSQTNDNLIKAIAPMLSNLTSISLLGCVQLTDKSVSDIAFHCPLLRELNLCECCQLTDEVIFIFCDHCKKLTDVELTGCPLITNDSVSELVWNNKSLLHLTPGFLRYVPQAEELLPETDIRDQLTGR